MVISHLLFDKPGVYSPRICPRAVLWQRTDDPLFGVFVPSVENARRFADVVVVHDGLIVRQLLREEQGL